MVGILVSFWEGLFSGAMLVLGRVNDRYQVMKCGKFNVFPCFFFGGGRGSILIGKVVTCMSGCYQVGDDFDQFERKFVVVI